jgi:hypothetical protein
MIGHFRMLIEGMVADPKKLSDLPLLAIRTQPDSRGVERNRFGIPQRQVHS